MRGPRTGTRCNLIAFDKVCECGLAVVVIVWRIWLELVGVFGLYRLVVEGRAGIC